MHEILQNVVYKAWLAIDCLRLLISQYSLTRETTCIYSHKQLTDFTSDIIAEKQEWIINAGCTVQRLAL